MDDFDWSKITENWTTSLSRIGTPFHWPPTSSTAFETPVSLLNSMLGGNIITSVSKPRTKATFTTNRDLFEPQVMFFRLTKSPTTFQALMNTIFTNLVVVGKVAVYLDNIFIYSLTREEHRDTMHEVLQRLSMHDLYLRPEKCEFDREEIEYLSLIIKQGKVLMDPVKVKAVTDWPTPRNL